MALRQYYYNQQLRKAAMTFANIFAGMTVRTGLNGCGEVTELQVPIRYASSDRVVALLGAHNTQNALTPLPLMAIYLSGISVARERVKAVGAHDNRTYLPQGGIFPDDVQVIHRVQPIPYNLQFELTLFTSNQDQAFQVMEQILMLFDYEVQVQSNDAAFDWTKITCVRIDDGGFTSGNAEPMGTDRAVYSWNASFMYEAWISPPMEVRKDIIRQINVRISEAAMPFQLEMDASGNLVDGTELMTFVVTAADEPSV